MNRLVILFGNTVCAGCEASLAIKLPDATTTRRHLRSLTIRRHPVSVAATAQSSYCGATRLAWSTRTPIPMVLETDTFFM